MSNPRRQRQSFPFLKPLTPLTPNTKVDSPAPTQHVADIGPTSKASLPSSTYGPRQRAKSFADKESRVAYALPTTSLGGSRVVTPTSTAPSSRRSSFAHSALSRRSSRRPSMSAREPTMSRRGSMWGDVDEVVPDNSDLTEEEKVIEAQNAFCSSLKALWGTGLGGMIQDTTLAFSNGWQNGEMIALFTVDNIGLSKLEHAHVLVLLDQLSEQLRSLATSALAHPSAVEALKSPSSAALDAFFTNISASPAHLALLLQALDSFAKLSLRLLPAMAAHLDSPRSFTDTVQGVLHIASFLTGSSTDLRRAIIAGIVLINEAISVLDDFNRAVIAISASLPSFGIVAHPSGTFLHSPEHTLSQFSTLKAHFHALTSQPGYSLAHTVFLGDIRAVWNGLVGNARVARTIRGAERIWQGPGGWRDKVSNLLQGLDVIGWELSPISDNTDDFSYSFTSLRPHFPSLVPQDVSISHSAGSSGAPTVVTLRGLALVIDSAVFDITKRGLLGFSDSGKASITVPFDLEISLQGGVQVSAKTGKVDLVLSSDKTTGGVVGKVWDAWLGIVVRAKIAEAIEDRFDDVVKAWLAPFFSSAASSPSAAAVAVPAFFAATLAGTPGLMSPPLMNPAPSILPTAGFTKPPVSAGPSGARAAFLASLRMTSGMSIPNINTGRDVLNSLENPFASGPNSAAAGEHDDDDSNSNDGMKSRRMSMAMSLTDVSMADVTAIETIMNPPRAQSTSNIFLEEESRPAISRRLSLAYTPAGEPSLDAYDVEHSPTPPNGAISPREGGGQAPAMADFLDERSEMDTTTLEGILATSVNLDLGFADVRGSEYNIPMAAITQELQGVQTEVEQTTTTAGRPQARRSPRESYAAPPPPLRRKSMSEWMTEASMVDQTNTTISPGPRIRPTEPSAFTSLENIPAMSDALDAISSVDTTLHEHIATPPRSRHSSFAAGGARTARKSFVELSSVPSMADLGIDEHVARDETEVVDSASPKSRRASGAENVYAGLDPAQLKARRMSNWLTEDANVDTTLVENIRNPPSVDQTYHHIASMPHSLSRRASMAAEI